MITLEFIPQTGQNVASPKFSPSALNDKGMLTALLNEATAGGKTIELIDHDHDNDSNLFVKSMTFGIGADSRQTGIISDSVFPTFFVAGRVFPYLVVFNNTATVLQLSGGTTPAGTELFSSQTIAANGYTSIPLQGGVFTTTAVTPFYLHHGEDGDTWNGIALPGIDIKTNSDPA